ncbi:EamA family transporter [Phenylobacterium sp.]|uniref:EamA family transporter n=1 Tax=Phenylobacterium sp. TaxID=1871053 RepID=UPI0035B3A504
MTLLALGLVVCGSVLHALWNILAKRGASGPLFVWTYSAVSCALYTPLVVWAVSTTPVAWTLAAVGAVVLSGFLHLGYSLALQGGYRRADLSVVYPVARGAGPSLSVAGAVLLLGEPFTPPIAVGAALVVGGVFLVGFSGRTPGKPFWPGVMWGGLTGLFIAAYTLNDGHAVKALAVPPLLVDYFGNLVRLTALTPLALRRRRELAAEFKVSGRAALGVGVIAPIPYILSLYAMTLAPLSLIAPARELSMMVGVLFGRLMLKERASPGRFAGAGLILAGVVVLALG